MKTLSKFTHGLAALALAPALLAITASSCTDIDDSVKVDYTVYASPDLLSLTTVEVTVGASDRRNETYTPAYKDFKVSDDYHITAGDTGMYSWTTSDHFDNFGVESSVSVIYRLREDIDFTTLQGQYVIAHGVAGAAHTRDKDGDWYDVPIVYNPDAEVFDLPADAGALQTYLIDLQGTPDVVRVSVNGVGLPTVAYK